MTLTLQLAIAVAKLAQTYRSDPNDQAPFWMLQRRSQTCDEELLRNNAAGKCVLHCAWKARWDTIGAIVGVPNRLAAAMKTPPRSDPEAAPRQVKPKQFFTSRILTSFVWASDA
jgi:hypothetical protein